MSEPLRLALSVLAVWRVTHLIATEDGPGDILFRLRRALADSLWGKLMDCFQCSSLWVAAPLSLWVGTTWIERAVAWPALSGAAILLQRLVEGRQGAWFHEAPVDEEQNDALLRKGTSEPENTGSDDRLS